MHGIFKARGLAFAATLALLGGTVWIAAGTTGAYFSDTHSGTVSGTVGSIQVHTTGIGGTGTDGMNLSFVNMLPGEPQTVKVNYTNTGTGPEDVYIVFPNATALSALNNLGMFGEAHLSANGHALFDSANLNDRVETCIRLEASGCWPLVKQYLVASNLAPGVTGNVSFTFAYGSQMVTPPTAFNNYPETVDGLSYLEGGSKKDQRFIDHNVLPAAGLPYQIVATQMHQEP